MPPNGKQKGPFFVKTGTFSPYFAINCILSQKTTIYCISLITLYAQCSLVFECPTLPMYFIRNANHPKQHILSFFLVIVCFHSTYGLSCTAYYAVLSDEELDEKVNTIVELNSNIGYRLVSSYKRD